HGERHHRVRHGHGQPRPLTTYCGGGPGGAPGGPPRPPGGPPRISPLKGSPCNSFHFVFCTSVRSFTILASATFRSAVILLRASSSGGEPGWNNSRICRPISSFRSRIFF